MAGHPAMGAFCFEWAWFYAFSIDVYKRQELATAMECRCYHGGEGRTRLKTLRLTAKDWLLSAVCVAVLCCIACSGALWARFWG